MHKQIAKKFNCDIDFVFVEGQAACSHPGSYRCRRGEDLAISFAEKIPPFRYAPLSHWMSLGFRKFLKNCSDQEEKLKGLRPKGEDDRLISIDND